MRTLAISDPTWLPEALARLRAGGLVAFPTETVYGLAAGLHDPRAIDRIYELKGRPVSKALPWQVDSMERALGLGLHFSRGALALATRFWPGPLTLLLARPPGCPAWFAPAERLVALRIPDHPVALALLGRMGLPLAVTSANPSGGQECLSAHDVARVFGGADLLVVDGGRAKGGVASTVVDATGPSPLVRREGPLALPEILEVWRGEQ